MPSKQNSLVVQWFRVCPPNTEVQVREPRSRKPQGRAKTKGCLGQILLREQEPGLYPQAAGEGTLAADQFCAGLCSSPRAPGKASKALGLLMPGSLRIRAG